MLMYALTLCAQGRTDEYMKTVCLIPEEVITLAREQTLTGKRAPVVFLPGADDDWDKSDWTEEQVRNDTVVFAHVKHARKMQLKDPITIAEEQRLNKEVVAKICEEVDALAVTERKEARKKELASKKALNPENYIGDAKEEVVETAVKAPPILNKEGKRSKLQIEMDLAEAAATDTRTLKDCLLDGTAEQFKAMRKDGLSEHDIAVKLELNENVAIQLSAFIDTVN